MATWPHDAPKDLVERWASCVWLCVYYLNCWIQALSFCTETWGAVMTSICLWLQVLVFLILYTSLFVSWRRNDLAQRYLIASGFLPEVKAFAALCVHIHASIMWIFSKNVCWFSCKQIENPKGSLLFSIRTSLAVL